MKTRRCLTFIAAAAALTIGSAVWSQKAGEKILLRPHFEKGKTLNLRQTSDQTISQTLQGQAFDMQQTFGTGYSFTVENVSADGSATVKTTFHSVLFKMTGPMGTIEYDSENPPETVHDMARGFAAMVGQSFTIVFSPDLKVKEVRDVDVMLKKMIESLSMPESPMRTSMEKNLESRYGEEALGENMTHMFSLYPGKPVGVGDSWTKKYPVNKGFSLIEDTTWTVKERKNDTMTVAVQSSLSTNPDADDSMGVQYKLKGEQTGTMELNETTGWTTSGTVMQTLEGTVIPNKEVTGMTESWPIKIESKITYSMF